MRSLFVLATLLLFTLPLAAQESEPSALDAGEPLVERVEAPASAVIDLDPVEAEAGVVHVEIQEVQLLTEPPSEIEPAVRQPDSRNWWWTVGAIVTAGVILAVVL